jgi:hydroxypyruvate reductase
VLVDIAEEVSATGTPLDPPAVLISGGETTVEVSGDGSGGSNQELAVSAALELSDPHVTVAAVDTDGNASAAGGIVTSDTPDDRRFRQRVH